MAKVFKVKTIIKILIIFLFFDDINLKITMIYDSNRKCSQVYWHYFWAMMNLSPNGDVNFVELLDLGVTSNVIVYIHTQGRPFNLDSA